MTSVPYNAMFDNNRMGKVTEMYPSIRSKEVPNRTGGIRKTVNYFIVISYLSVLTLAGGFIYEWNAFPYKSGHEISAITATTRADKAEHRADKAESALRKLRAWNGDHVLLGEKIR